MTLIEENAVRTELLYRAAEDFFFLQNRGYPRLSALEWVGNRYALDETERRVLRRGVLSQETACRRKAKRSLGGDWQKGLLVVDGHNVHITVESAVLGRPLLIGNDGALRDIAGVSSSFRRTMVADTAMDMIFHILDEHRPRKVLFLFDAPMSHSGALASEYRRRLKSMGLSGNAEAVPVPENEIPYENCTVAGSDGAVLDASSHWLDLARMAVDASCFTTLCADFSPFILSFPRPGIF